MSDILILQWLVSLLSVYLLLSVLIAGMIKITEIIIWPAKFLYNQISNLQSTKQSAKKSKEQHKHEKDSKSETNQKCDRFLDEKLKEEGVIQTKAKKLEPKEIEPIVVLWQGLNDCIKFINDLPWTDKTRMQVTNIMFAMAGYFVVSQSHNTFTSVCGVILSITFSMMNTWIVTKYPSENKKSSENPLPIPKDKYNHLKQNQEPKSLVDAATIVDSSSPEEMKCKVQEDRNQNKGEKNTKVDGTIEDIPESIRKLLQEGNEQEKMLMQKLIDLHRLTASSLPTPIDSHKTSDDKFEETKIV